MDSALRLLIAEFEAEISHRRNQCKEERSEDVEGYVGEAVALRDNSGAGSNALFAADEFFRATINNPHTRRAYGRAVSQFLCWCEGQALELGQVSPVIAGSYLEELGASAPTKNQALAALRHFFDALVTRHVVALNPFASVRGAKHSVMEGSARGCGSYVLSSMSG